MKYKQNPNTLIGSLLLACLTLLTSAIAIAKPKPPKQSLLWKISGKGMEKPSYLYGTIHIICEEDYFMADEVKKAFAATDRLVMELDLAEMQDPINVQKYTVNPGMKNISSEYGTADSTTIDNFLVKHYGAGLQQFGVIKPFVLYSMVMLKSINCSNQKSYENSFNAMAKEAGKEVKGLETFAFQAGIFDNIPNREIMDWTLKSIREAESGGAEFHAMIDYYKKGDLDGLFGLMTEKAPEFMKYEKQLLSDRNANWVPLIEELVKEKPTFIAVGAAHLPAKNGVLQLLKKKGYKVESVVLKQ